MNDGYLSCPNPNLAEKYNLADQLHKSRRNVQLVSLVAKIQICTDKSNLAKQLHKSRRNVQLICKKPVGVADLCNLYRKTIGVAHSSENYKSYQIHGDNYTFLIKKCSSYSKPVASCVFLEKSSTHIKTWLEMHISCNRKNMPKIKQNMGTKKIC